MAAAKKKMGGLGRGLDALLADQDAPREAPRAGLRSLSTLPIEFLRPDPTQPRRSFNEDAIKELAESIKSRGLLQPILARPLGRDDNQIVAGERRWRAAQLARLHEVPVVIRELTDVETAEIALIENVQRVDLNAAEEAMAYQRLAEHHKRTQEEIARAVGKSRSHVANMMRLLALPEAPLEALKTGQITMGHARALLGATDPSAALKQVVKSDLSVRQTEELVRLESKSSGDTAKAKEASDDLSKAPEGPSGAKKDADTRALESDLAAALGLEVAIDHQKKGHGALTIKYLSLDQLDDVCRRLMGAGV